jgi:hypothetical protein
LANRLSCNLDVEIHSQSIESVRVTTVLSGATSTPTYVLDLDHNILIKVRRKGMTTSWSKEVVISKDKVPTSHMLYVSNLLINH